MTIRTCASHTATWKPRANSMCLKDNVHYLPRYQQNRIFRPETGHGQLDAHIYKLKIAKVNNRLGRSKANNSFRMKTEPILRKIVALMASTALAAPYCLIYYLF
ncbi:hypothetical protein EGW08_020910 [Elysia chlorotica]|uniref:Uncharacterized protein n=1 Tax=Elysia chlorotica TaxID=188477 RepID=A0A3S1B3W3_ELYCH|nr:hypothetical protein EGW08_020910 [Elysia chlorotica]